MVAGCADGPVRQFGGSTLVPPSTSPPGPIRQGNPALAKVRMHERELAIRWRFLVVSRQFP